MAYVAFTRCRHVADVLAGRSRAVVTGLASAGDAGVIEHRGCPCHSAMAVVALGCRGDVRCRLARRSHAVVTGRARSRGDRGVIETCRCPRSGRVAAIAIVAACNVTCGFPRCLHSVVAAHTVATDQHVIELRGRPCCRGVATIAGIAAGNVIERLAGGLDVVVTACAAAPNLRVVEPVGGTPCNHGVTVAARLAAHDVICRFGKRVDSGAGCVTAATLARRALEHRRHMAGLAGHVAMRAFELEAGRQMIESPGCRLGRRRLGPGQEQQSQRYKYSASAVQGDSGESFRVGVLHVHIPYERVTRGSTPASPFEGGGGMTLLALTAELAEVNVILLVAGCAIARELNLCGRFTMTLSTLQLLVAARQRELCLRMIELPQLPTIGRVAIAARGAEIASMDIPVGMTAATSGIGARKRMVRMTRGARHDDMQPDERKVREIVIEAERWTPRIVAMALLAIRAGSTRVNIIHLVTGAASLVCGVIFERASVASVAGEIAMPAEQGKVRVAKMIERRRTPGFVRVAATAFGAEARGVGIVGTVAAFAGARKRLLEIARAMTLLALHVGVGA